MNPTPQAMKTEITILGGGLVGMAAAIAMHELGLNTLLIDQSPALRSSNPEAAASNKGVLATPWDARVYAISPKNVEWLTQLGIWQYMHVERVANVNTMQLMTDDADLPLMLSALDAHHTSLATIVEASQLQQAMVKRLQALNIAVLNDTQCQDLTAFDRHIAIQAETKAQDGNANNATQTHIESQLLIAADGANSWVRSSMHLNVESKPYAHTAIVANFRVEQFHDGIASQWFLHDSDHENCILAFLPLASINGVHTISIVLSVSDTFAAKLMALSDVEFTEHVKQMSHDALGVMTLETARHTFPLRLQTSEMISEHVVLIGDAAHVVHPMAGQGVNLGFRDIIDLTRTLQQKSPMQKLYDTQLLKKYTRSRKADVANIQLLTDGLFKLFSMQSPVLQKVRQLSFNATKLAKVKQLLLKVALAQ